MNSFDVVVAGGGAAGLMAAGRAAQLGKSVAVIEKNKRTAKKVLITGKGRCNVTNNCDNDTFLKNIPVNPRFMFSSINNFNTFDTMRFFEQRGVELKTERGNRVFPVSDKASDIACALEKYAVENKAEIICGEVFDIIVNNGNIEGVVLTNGEKILSKSVIIATGGCSYPATGSTGDGYKIARRHGHTVTPLRPSLVPVEMNGKICRDLMGLSLKNVRLRVYDDKKILFDDQGELLFTHFGMSGPLVLSASSHMKSAEDVCFSIDLKPALTNEQLDNRLLRDFKKYANKDFINSLSDLFPHKLIPVIASLSGIPFNRKVHQISREERHSFAELVKDFRFISRSFRPIEEAIITSGGISVKEINPKTMQSKLINGLFFAGEIIDVDGYTGGFNLQIAFSTGVAAGENA